MTSDLPRELQATLGPDFRLQRELGGGGMSRVFLADDTRLGRRVVVKVLSPEVGAGLSADRFEREIRVAARLQDPRIVPVLQAGHSGDLPFYIMPYVEGESLRARLERSPLPLEEALGVLRDVALALEYAHGRQVIHRDIKPENILISGRTAVVADFGIAKAITDASPDAGGATLTSRGTLLGTPAYMAPEQAAGDAVDARTDIYGWGVIAYEILSGRHPFASRTTAQALMLAHMTDPPVPLAERRRDLPAALTTLVDRCLAKDAASRPGDAGALVAGLSAAVAPRPIRLAGLKRALGLAAITSLLLAAPGTLVYRRTQRRRWARESAIPEAAKLSAESRRLAAYLVLSKAQRIVPADTQIARAIEDATHLTSLTSSPAGATVSMRDYLSPDSAWYELGVTPLRDVRIPGGYFRWRVSKPGFGEMLIAPIQDSVMNFALDSALSAPEGMVRVGPDRWGDMIAFVGWVGPYALPAFYLDRLEVTNRQYQRFIDEGGYSTRKYWQERFLDSGRELTWDQAMALFRDRSGRAGPATWVGGHFPEGQDDYPVSGVSWYEASAYAAFAGGSLPTFAQWYETAPADVAPYVVQASNIARDHVAPVGAFRGLGPFGTYDMAGNVREWAMNSLGPDRRFILGGAWDSQTYLYADPEALSPFDRSPQNGIRCVRNLAPLPPAATKSIEPLERDFARYRPASDAVFTAYRALYAYGPADLHARVEGVVRETPDWREEKVTFDAAYGNERMAAYLFLPRRVRPPYQAVVFFPSARVLDLRDSGELGDVSFFDYIVQSGRAVVYPIYQNTYERRVRSMLPGGSQDIDITVQRYKDLARTLDYLQTRPDVAGGKLAYLGVSMGSAEGVIYAALAQDRLKTVVFLDGGYFLDPPPAGGDQADFAPRLTRPVLMVNGRYDFTFSLERSQLPLFRMLGTPDADKRHVVLETPHDVRADRPALVREVLDWLDRYLGRVE